MHEFKRLQRFRPLDINLQVSCGAQPGTLHLKQQGEMSTILASPSRGTIPVSVVRLDDVWDAYVPVGAQVHFCKIDVEGFERQVLLGINLSRHRPWMFCIESTLPGTNIPAWDKWEGILLANGYTLWQHHRINRFYHDAVNHPEIAGERRQVYELMRQWKVVRGEQPR
jgi:hypothetical protein